MEARKRRRWWIRETVATTLVRSEAPVGGMIGNHTVLLTKAI